MSAGECVVCVSLQCLFFLCLSRQSRKIENDASPLSLVPLHLLNHQSFCLFCLIRTFYYTEMCNTQTTERLHLEDYRSPTMKRSYLQSRPWLNVSVVLPIVLKKQLGLDFEVKRNSDYADHFTTHCRVIDSQSIGCNLYTSSLIRDY